MSCDSRIRPFRPVNDTEVRCEQPEGHENPARRHVGILRDYAHPGSETIIDWTENDRRTFHGEWPGDCLGSGGDGPCILPLGHHGRCAS